MKFLILTFLAIFFLQVISVQGRRICREVPDDVDEIEEQTMKRPISHKKPSKYHKQQEIIEYDSETDEDLEPIEDGEGNEGSEGESQGEETSSLIECPDLSKCRRVKGLSTPYFENKGPSGTVCSYTEDHLNSCSLSRTASFCVLQGITFNSDEILINADGTTLIEDC